MCKAVKGKKLSQYHLKKKENEYFLDRNTLN